MTPTSNSHSYFWRHPEQMEALSRHLRRFAGVPALKVWSAGCAQGEEPYTLAFLLDSLGFDFDILATDVNSEALSVAEAGVYREDKLRLLPRRYRLKELPDGEFAVPERFLSKLQFQLSDLHQEFVPQPVFDLISCRNVLIYFSSISQDTIIERLVHSLKIGGILMLGYAESSLIHIPGLTRLDEHGLFLRCPTDLETTTEPLKDKPLEDPLRLALKSYAGGELMTARSLFELSLMDKPEFLLGHYFKALIELELGHLAEAANHLNSVLNPRAAIDSATSHFLQERKVSEQQFLYSANLARRRLEALR